jgi:1-acyl-sn-glycerol-3-phosphate acyltransferase
MTKRGVLKPHPLIVALRRAIVLRFLKRRYRLEAVGADGVRNLKPPFVVVANHVNFWDPFWINSFISAPIQFVASDNLFRTTFLGLAMRLLGSIPKTKLMNDSQTIGHIFRVLGAGGVVGIFPEGTRSYDGRSEPTQLAVARLIRKLKLPVVSVLISGGYLARPRWARGVRLGKVSLRYRLLFTGGDLSARSVEEVHHILSRDLSFDEMAVQRQRQIPFPTRRPAEYLERMLFICPRCHSVGTLTSRVRRFWCTSCGCGARVNDLGFFTHDTVFHYFEDPADWNAWQMTAFRDFLYANTSPEEPRLRENDAAMLRGYRVRRLRRHARGRLRLFPDRLEFEGPNGNVASFAIPLIRGANVQNGEKLEFYYGGMLYRLDFSNPRSSSYMWVKAIEILQEGSNGRGKAASL